MKPQDFQIKKANEKRKVVRQCKLNDKDMEVAIEVTLNHKRGLYTIKPNINPSHVEPSEAKQKALCKLVSELLFEAIKDAEAWKADWHDANGTSGKLPMGFDED